MNEGSRYPRLVIAAPGSGSGKTLITCALLALLQKRGLSVQAFKCGPDYIDPLFHRRVLNVPSVNLDTWFTGQEKTRELFARHMNSSCARLGIIEGVMGLYDGLGGITGEASTYDLAETLMAPILLVVDAHGMGRSVIAEIRGFQEMDQAGLIAGVILNRTSPSFAGLVGPEILKMCGIPVIGCLPVEKSLHMESRHLGLKLPGEIPDLARQVETAALLLGQSMDVDQLLELAGAQAFPADRTENRPLSFLPFRPAVRIAVAMDEAFCFYYEDNLRLLEQLGAELVFFSPTKDPHLPEGISGLYLGGGYPELKAAELSANVSMREEIRAALKSGMPSIAECGGFLYLHDDLEVPAAAGIGEGTVRFPMVGAVRGSCRYQGRSVRFGYCSVTEHHPVFLPEGKPIRGHEFHYYDSDANGTDCRAVKPVSGRSWDCVFEGEHSWWGFPHLYWLSAPEYAEYYVRCCRKWSGR